MVILLAGATHTGKTRMAQKLLERYQLIDRAYPEELELVGRRPPRKIFPVRLRFLEKPV